VLQRQPPIGPEVAKALPPGLCGLLTKLIALFIPECEWCSSFVCLKPAQQSPLSAHRLRR